MRKFITKSMFFLCLLQSQFAWPAITTSAWKMFFKTLAEKTSLSPTQIVQIGLDLKTAEHASHTFDEEGMQRLLLTMRSGIEEGDATSLQKTAKATPSLDEEQIVSLSEIFESLESFYFKDLHESLLHDYNQKGLFSKNQVEQFRQLRSNAFEHRRQLLLGHSPQFQQLVKQDSETFFTFEALPYEEKIEALVRASSLRGGPANEEKKYLVNAEEPELNNKFLFLLLLNEVSAVLDDPQFSHFFQKNIWFLFEDRKSTPKWMQTLRDCVASYSISFIVNSEDGRSRVLRDFVSAYHEGQKRQFITNMKIGIAAVSAATVLTSPLWWPIFFAKDKQQEH